MLSEKLSIAPMMEVTDAHWRYLVRGMTKKTVLYTEMVVDDTLNFGGPSQLDFCIGKKIEENPSVIQLGGSNPETLAEAAYKCNRYRVDGGADYSEINLNCGCPSPRVSKRCFGASLMLDPELVRQIVSSMIRRVDVPVTVKCRIGADNRDSYAELVEFIQAAHAGGVNKFIIHARKAFLNGLSPKQNRDVPPLKYHVVHQLCKDFPDLEFILNGGITTFDAALDHMRPEGYYYHGQEGIEKGKDKEEEGGNVFFASEQGEGEYLPPVHGVMLGRAAQGNPILFATADSTFFGVDDPCLTRRQIVERYANYCEWVQGEEGPCKIYDVDTSSEGSTNPRNKCNKKMRVPTSLLLRPMHNMMSGIRNNSRWKRALNDLHEAKVKGVNGVPNPCPREILMQALDVMMEEDIDAPVGRKKLD